MCAPVCLCWRSAWLIVDAAPRSIGMLVAGRPAERQPSGASAARWRPQICRRWWSQIELFALDSARALARVAPQSPASGPLISELCPSCFRPKRRNSIGDSAAANWKTARAESICLPHSRRVHLSSLLQRAALAGPLQWGQSFSAPTRKRALVTQLRSQLSATLSLSLSSASQPASSGLRFRFAKLAQSWPDWRANERAGGLAINAKSERAGRTLSGATRAATMELWRPV